jgi:hypothetical protein
MNESLGTPSSNMSSSTKARPSILNESKSKNYQDGKDKERDRCNPIASGRSVSAHGTIPLKTSVTLPTAIAPLIGAVCHPDVTFRSHLGAASCHALCNSSGDKVCSYKQERRP